jgi:hypothetical protein
MPQLAAARLIEEQGLFWDSIKAEEVVYLEMFGDA